MDTPILGWLGRWIANLDESHVPAESLQAARYQLANMLAAAFSAAGAEELNSVRRAIETLCPGAGRSTIYSTGRRCPPVEAALANAAYHYWPTRP
jgi:2-methylcitrate dehydratase PrpD